MLAAGCLFPFLVLLGGAILGAKLGGGAEGSLVGGIIGLVIGVAVPAAAFWALRKATSDKEQR